MSIHPCHKKQISKINRALGQLEAVKRMVGDGQYCVDIMTQLRAVRNAIKAIELGVLEVHVDSCITAIYASEDAGLRKKRIGEIMDLLRKYE